MVPVDFLRLSGVPTSNRMDNIERMMGGIYWNYSFTVIMLQLVMPTIWPVVNAKYLI